MNSLETTRVVEAVVRIADALTKLARAQADLASAQTNLAFEAKLANKSKERLGY